MTFRSPAESPTPTSSRANRPLLDALQKHVLDRAVPALDRALADLDEASTVGRIHLAEAISYRLSGERLAATA